MSRENNAVSSIAPELDERGVVLACAHCGQLNRLPFARLGTPARCSRCKNELPSPDQPLEVSNENIFNAATAFSALPVLVDFWAPWCGPCRMLAPEVAKAARARAGRVLVLKVNTEDLPMLAQRFRVSAIPLLALFRAGREIARQAGAMPALAILQFIEDHR
jgi:thioredoxin 2